MIIGIVGLIGSGKSTVGEILCNKYHFGEESFAKPLKDACSVIFGWDRELLEGKTQKARDFREEIDPYWSKILDKPNFTPRLALQWMGTQAGRNVFGENLWTASCIKRCSGIRNYVVTDTRFKNEVDAIRKAGGYVVRVKRGDDPDWMKELMFHEETREDFMQKNYPEIHQSEWDWVGSQFDWIILNNGNHAHLDKLVEVFHTYLTRDIHHEIIE